MRTTNRRSIRRLLAWQSVVILGLVCCGCSRRDKTDEEGASPSAMVAEEQMASAEELQVLRQENDHLKKAMAQATLVLDEVKMLRQNNEDLRQAVSGVPSLQLEVERLRRENETLQSTRNAANTADELVNNAAADIPARQQAAEESYRRYLNSCRQRAASLLARYDSAGSVKVKLEFMESLADSASRQDPAVVGVIRKALADPDSTVVRAAADLLAEYETREILPAVEQALMLADEQVRIAAVNPLSAIDDLQVIRLLMGALDDTSVEVRRTALGEVDEHASDPIKLSVMEAAIASPYDDVKRGVLSMLESRSDHIAVELLMEGLKDPDPGFRTETGECLSFLIDQEFKTYEEARAWWTSNKDRYDAELVRIDE
ncbi:MAG: HEAT repeat domain-containing protein [Phycisphaerae bacterium]|nr:HEAT repeat domain-containing protein [Phycisphaerae bacterium]